jgi:ABC-type phosphate/phosphonate transport system ATPase subunit
MSALIVRWPMSVSPTAPRHGHSPYRAVRRNGFRSRGPWWPSRNCCYSTSRSAALDALTRLSMRGLLLDLWREHGFGVLLVTHDVDEAIALADRVLVLDDGRVVHTLAIDDPRESAHTEQYRAELLDKLGVKI